jgi:hypothetical protein
MEMSALQFGLLYFGAGLFFLVLALVVNRVFKAGLFWGVDFGAYHRNYLEFAILFAWVVVVPILVIFGLVYLLARFFGLFIGGPPSDGSWQDGLYDSLLEKGLSSKEAKKVLEEVGGGFK